MQKKKILILDVGTTNIKGLLFNQNIEIIASSVKKPSYIMEKKGQMEQDPKEIWEMSLGVLKETLRKADCPMEEVDSIGISTQRASFMFWDKYTGKIHSNIITWQDKRAAAYAEKVTKSLYFRFLRGFSKMMYFFTRSEKFLTASQMEFNADYASIRTSYYLNNHPKLNKEIQKANTNIVWGTIDSWILWNLTHNHIHATDFSNASSTGMLDPFTLEWNKLVLDKLGIPLHILPSLKNTNANFSTTKIFGTPAIPIRCIFADQQASMFGQCCFNKGEMKVTNGTGSFVDLNTGESPHASKRKLYPLIAWRTDNKTIYKLEGMSHNTGNIIDWIKDELELFSDYDELEELVRQADSDGNVFFLPTFSSGISYPYWDPTARGNIFGISLKTTKADILQAVLNGIAFRIKDFVHGIIKDTGVKITQIKADGGVSRNQYFLQFLSDILGLKVIHSEHPEPTALGAAFMAGLATGFFKSKEELVKLCQTNEVYEPQISKEKRNNLYASWKDIVKRSLNYRH